MIYEIEEKSSKDNQNDNICKKQYSPAETDTDIPKRIFIAYKPSHHDDFYYNIHNMRNYKNNRKRQVNPESSFIEKNCGRGNSDRKQRHDEAVNKSPCGKVAFADCH